MSIIATSTNLVDDLLEFARNEGYGPGDRLPPIPKLAVALGIGRNAVRDGLLEAQTRGFVRIEPRLGVFLRDAALSPPTGEPGLVQAGLIRPGIVQNVLPEQHNLFHVMDSRLLVEVELAGQAARTRRPDDLLPLRQALEAVLESHADRAAYVAADETFHLEIARIAGNRVLSAFLQSLWRMLQPAKRNLTLSAENREQTDREHQELYQSIVEGDADWARATMRAHLGKGRALLLEFVRTVPQARAAGV